MPRRSNFAKQSYEKMRAEQKEPVLFLCRMHRNFAKQSTKSRVQNKINSFIFYAETEDSL